MFCVSAVGVIGVGTYLKEHYQPEQVCLIGYDFNDQSAQLLQSHYCSALIYQDPRKQGYQALHLLFNYLCSRSLPAPKELSIRTGIILSETLRDYIDE